MKGTIGGFILQELIIEWYRTIRLVYEVEMSMTTSTSDVRCPTHTVSFVHVSLRDDPRNDGTT
jgi:hypothetical protein